MSKSENSTSLLVVVLDTNSVWWGQQLSKSNRELTFTQCVDALLVFCNSHLMLSKRNQLCIIAAHGNSSRYLYPRKDSGLDDTASDEADAVSSRISNDGQYELFTEVVEAVREELKDFVLNDHSQEFYSDCLLAGAMSMALCYINRMLKEHPVRETLLPRLMVVKGTEDNPSQYMNFMNVVFTAQKLNVVIDACVLDNDSGLLQQACDITEGTYLRIPQHSALLQYLLWIFLPDAAARTKLTQPSKVKVDYRAACFCHRTLIEIGYVCSICLSIFCAFSPICQTCHATFKIPAPPAKKKGKK